MNELEKAGCEQEPVTPSPEVAETNKECVEESSPAMDLENVADIQQAADTHRT